MPELRTALVGLGLLFLVGLALWEWYRSRRRHAPRPGAEPAVMVETVGQKRRVEPSMDGMSGLSAADTCEPLEVPTIHPVEPVRLGVAAEAAVDIPAAARFEAPAAPTAIQWPPEHTERVLSLRVVSARGEPLQGRALRIALEGAGLLHGPQKIFHRVTRDGAVLASVANLMRPGNFDPALMDAQGFRGLSVFSVLPGALSAERMLDELVTLARSLAHRLSAVVQDEHGADLDGVRLTQIRQSLREAAGAAGDGTAP